MQAAYLTANVLYHSLIADKEVPPGSKSEHENAGKNINWTEMAKAKAARLAHDEKWLSSLGSFAHFGAFFGATDITGEPPDEERVQQSKQDYIDREHERMLEGNERMLAKLRAKQAAAREHRQG